MKHVATPLMPPRRKHRTVFVSIGPTGYSVYATHALSAPLVFVQTMAELQDWMRDNLAEPSLTLTGIRDMPEAAHITLDITAKGHTVTHILDVLYDAVREVERAMITEDGLSYHTAQQDAEITAFLAFPPACKSAPDPIDFKPEEA